MSEADNILKFSNEDIPLVCEGLNIMEFDVSPEEGYILGRMDGSSNVLMLLESSGLGKDKTSEIINSLVEKQLVVFKSSHCEVNEEKKPDSDKKESQPDNTENTISTDIKDIKKTLKKQKILKGSTLKILIEAIYANIEHFSYYDLLGINPNSDPKNMKKAYLIRTKSFHPDKFYRSDDKEFKMKIQEVFKQVNKGYKVLSDPAKKEEYDSSLSDEEMLYANEEVETEIKSESRTKAVKGEASPWKRIRVSNRKSIQEKVRKKKPVATKPTGPKLKLDFSSNKSKSPLLKKINQMKKEGMQDQIKQAKRLYDGAMMEIQQGSISAAAINLKLAMKYDPGNKIYKKAFDDLESIKESKKAEQRFAKGVEAQEIGNFSLALQSYKDALRLGFESPALYHKMAEILLLTDGSHDKARTFVLKAIEMREGVPEFHLTLARIYSRLGQIPAARIQYNKVLKWEPKNKAVSKELKALRRK